MMLRASLLALVVASAIAAPASSFVEYHRVSQLGAHAQRVDAEARDFVAQIHAIRDTLASGSPESVLVTAATQTGGQRRSATAAQVAACDQFNVDFDGLIFDSTITTGPNAHIAVYPTGCSMMDIAQLGNVSDVARFSKACATTGTASATSCGSTGFYAKATPFAAKYNGMLHSSCAATILIGAGTAYASNLTMGLASTYLKTIGTITGMYCVKNNGVPCWPGFWAAANLPVGGDSGPTSAQLTTYLTALCTDCTGKIAEAIFLSMGGEDDSQANQFSTTIEMQCAKINGVLCYDLYFQYTGIPGYSSAERGAFVCENQCYALVKSREIEMNRLQGQPTENDEMSFTTNCFKYNNKYCYEYLAPQVNGPPPEWAAMIPSTSCGVPQGPDNLPYPAQPTSCAGTCSADLTAINTNWGCCFNTLRGATPTAFQAWLAQLESVCSATSPAACLAETGSTPVAGTLLIPNLKYSYASANAANVKQRIKSDAIMALGVSPKQCAIGEPMRHPDANTGTQTKITVTCTPATALQSGNIAALFDAFSAGRRSAATMTLGSTSGLPADSRFDTNTGASAQTSGSASCGANGCPSGNLDTIAPAPAPSSSSSSSGVLMIILIVVGAVVVVAAVGGVAVYFASAKPAAAPASATVPVKEAPQVSVGIEAAPSTSA